MGMGGKSVAKWMIEKEIKTKRRKSKHSCVGKGREKGQALINGGYV
jgi:hypothetical protein